ncbi:hypothetical protein IWW36_002494 [Coemansia brasiliensis]|uniref:Rho GTPase activation protein n=1 Tax=Coemansia brasiliensis TaxID=2650707 RepID=A0A9W8M0L1_9FUNG|nr:hypothetical protein IWW36_002494 [Coemansia brasiliensis]
MNASNGFADFAKKFNDFGNQLGDNIKRVFNEGQGPRRIRSSSDDVLGLDAEAFREATIAGNDGGELATYVNEKLICEAGVDFDSRPMLAFYACRLLNPDVVDYDRLLNLIQFRLDDFVESDYTVVLFAASARYNPSIKWLFNAYRRLGRKYKKNLKALYIVHPLKWVQVVMTAMNAVLSPKFAKKVKWIDTLSELAQAVPINQINIPPEVYQFNTTKEAKIKIPAHGRPPSRFFGVPLERLMGVHGEQGLPAPVADALDYLYTNALEVPDLFRRTPPPPTLQKVRNQYEAAGHVSIAYAVWGEHVAAAVLKTWCRELPQPIIPPHYYELIRQMPDPAQHPDQAAGYTRDIVLPALSDPPCVSLLLAALFGLLRAVADHSAINNMTSAKLAAAWAPNFVRSSQPDIDISMCSVTRFSEAPLTKNNASDDDDDDDVLDLSGGASENRPNVVTLARLMIDQYQLIFKPTLEAAEALAKQQVQRASVPQKPPRMPVGSTEALSAHSGPAPAVASDEDIAAVVAEMGNAKLSGQSPSRVVTAEDITRRLKAEQEAVICNANNSAPQGKQSDDDTDVIVVGNF